MSNRQVCLHLFEYGWRNHNDVINQCIFMLKLTSQLTRVVENTLKWHWFNIVCRLGYDLFLIATVVKFSSSLSITTKRHHFKKKVFFDRCDNIRNCDCKPMWRHQRLLYMICYLLLLQQNTLDEIQSHYSCRSVAYAVCQPWRLF